MALGVHEIGRGPVASSRNPDRLAGRNGPAGAGRGRTVPARTVAGAGTVAGRRFGRCPHPWPATGRPVAGGLAPAPTVPSGRRRYRWVRPDRTLLVLTVVVGIGLMVTWLSGRGAVRAAAWDGREGMPAVVLAAATPTETVETVAAAATPSTTRESAPVTGPGRLTAGGPAVAPAVAEEPARVVVRQGDTLWGLIARYGRPDRDPRDLVAAVMAANGLSSPALRPGMVLVIPPEVQAAR